MSAALETLHGQAERPSAADSHAEDRGDEARDESTCRSRTEAAHREAVERVVQSMRQKLDTPLSLPAMARVALLSPYHFNRVFRSITGVPPHTFLTALRMQEAKELLLTTQLRVIDISFSVGYQSVGTFTTRFKELVGMTPRGYRETSEETMCGLLGTLLANDDHQQASDRRPGAEVVGKVLKAEAPLGPTFVGLFRDASPGGLPVACALLTTPGHYHMAPVPDGRYRVMAAAFAWSSDIRDYLLPKDSRISVGVNQEPLEIRDGRVNGDADVRLRPKRPIDPPIVMSFPASAPHLGYRPLTSPSRGRAGALSGEV